MLLATLTSKKLLAYVLSEVTWTYLLCFGISSGLGQWTLITMIITKGFIQIGYILGQSYVDSYGKTLRKVLDQAGAGASAVIQSARQSSAVDPPTDPT